MRKILFVTALGLTACSANGPGFEAAANVVTSYAAAGTNTKSVTMSGRVQSRAATPNWTVAVITTKRTLAAVKVVNGSYSLPLPSQEAYESDTAVAVHSIWELVLFNDHNGNGTFDGDMPPSKANERDTEIPTVQLYKLSYKGYKDPPPSYIFLPRNDFQQGWIVVSRVGSQANQYHQDFTRSFDLTTSAYSDNLAFN